MEELKEMLTEAIFSHRWVLLEGYHTLGRKLVELGATGQIEAIASQLGQRPKTVHYAIELYKAYPDLNSLPMGKTVSWYKITKLLPPYEKNTTKKRDKKTKKGGEGSDQ